jgi:hypothetical protein
MERIKGRDQAAAGHTTAIIVVLLALAIGSSSALGSSLPHRYALRHGAHCHHGYKTVKHGGKPYCVRQKKKAPKPKHVRLAPPPSTSTTPPAPTTRVVLHAHVDPEYRQNPLDSFQVTYKFSAQAIQQAYLAESVPVGSPGPVPLPPGVLTLSSDGHLECSRPVGGAIDHSECTVVYEKLGSHTITATFTTDGESFTETVPMDVRPYPTQPVLTVNYRPWGEPTLVIPESDLWEIGQLSISLAAVPSTLQTRRACVFDPNVAIGHVDSKGCYVFLSERPVVFATAGGNCLAPEVKDIRIGEERWGARLSQALSPADIEAGVFHFRAEIQAGGGYAGSETITPIKFQPPMTLPPDC